MREIILTACIILAAIGIVKISIGIYKGKKNK